MSVLVNKTAPEEVIEKRYTHLFDVAVKTFLPSLGESEVTYPPSPALQQVRE